MLKTLALLPLLAAAPLPAPSRELPELPPGVTLVSTHVNMVGNTPYVLAVFSNLTAVSFRIGGESGVINLPDRALIALPGADPESVTAMAPLAFPAREPNAAAFAPGATSYDYDPSFDPTQGISGGQHPTEATYSYQTPVGTGFATIVITMRLPSRGKSDELVARMREHVEATQRVFRPR